MAHLMSTARLQFDVQLHNYPSSSPMKTPTNSAAACPPLPLFFQVLPLISLSLFVSKVLYQSITFWYVQICLYLVHKDELLVLYQSTSSPPTCWNGWIRMSRQRQAQWHGASKVILTGFAFYFFYDCFY
jgi:hypothetical protein